MANKNSNKLIYILSGIVVVLLVVGVVAKKKGWIGKPDALAVTVDKVKRSTIVEKVSASGKVQPETEVKISPLVSGEIIELKVSEGDSVVQGQLLLKIRPDNYQSMVDMQVAGVNTARANLAQAKARLAQAQANNTQAKLTHDRNKKLYNDKVISDAEFEQSKANFTVSNQELESARQSVRAAEFNVQSAQAALNEARENLSKTTIYAPVSGTISKLSVEKGERVVGTSQMAGTELLRIANLNTMEVRVFVNENDIIRVSVGDSAIVEVDSYSNTDEKFKGVVTSIANTAKDALTLEAVTEFEVRVRLINESYEHLLEGRNVVSPFRPGMTASVDIITERKENILTVPLSAVTTREADDKKKAKKQEQKNEDTNEPAARKRSDSEIKEVVFLNDNGKAKSVEVKTGISDYDNIEITSGLKEGQEVISGPFRAVSKQLKDGKAISVTDESSISKMQDSDQDEE